MIIGLTGYAGSGKDAVAEFLVREHKFKRYAFADKLRDMAYAINPTITYEGWPVSLQELIDGDGWDVIKREVPEVREILQRLGVWHRENASQDFWVTFVEQAWVKDGCPDAVVTDVRFPNEARWVRGRDLNPFDAETTYNAPGELWRITRPGVGPVNGHISEQLDLAADETILNNGTLNHLRTLVRLVMEGQEAAA